MPRSDAVYKTRLLVGKTTRERQEDERDDGQSERDSERKRERERERTGGAEA